MRWNGGSDIPNARFLPGVEQNSHISRDRGMMTTLECDLSSASVPGGKCSLLVVDENEELFSIEH